MAFFQGVFGWEFAPGNIEGGFHITGTNPSGGMHEGGSAPGFRPYFQVDDIQAAVQRVTAFGGTAGDVKGSPESGQYSDCADDQGTQFSLFQLPVAATPQ